MIEWFIDWLIHWILRSLVLEDMEKYDWLIDQMIE